MREPINADGPLTPLVGSSKPRGRPALRAWSLALALAAAAFASGLAAVNSHYNAPCATGQPAEHGYIGCLSAGQFAGTFVLVFAIPAVGGAYAQVVSFEPFPGARLVGGAAAAAAVFGLVQPQNAAPDILWVPAGMLLALMLGSLALAAHVRPLSLPLLVPFWALATAVFAPIWNKPARAYWAGDAHTDTLVAQVYVSADFNLKIYEDAIIYFCWLAGLLLLRLAPLPSRRVRLPLPPTAWYNPYPYGASTGELLLVGYVAALFGVWVWFWSYRFDYITLLVEDPFTMDETEPGLQRWARVMGHMASLSMSLLLFPVVRNATLPMPALKYHRIMGLVAYVCVCLHLLLWYVKWGRQGLLPHNMWTWGHLNITPLWSHYDNFTIPIVEVAWLALTGSLLLALRRRDDYQSFRLAHRAGVVFYFAAVWHAWSFWYYNVGGLLLFLTDYAIRTQRSAVSRRPVDVKAISGVLEISFAPEVLAGARPGQFVYLCAPRVSTLHWHPFSVSSPTTLHVGACRYQQQLREGDLEDLRVDGPYGSLGDRALSGAFATVLLVAGGIGITPLHAMYVELQTRPGIDVRLVWAMRDPQMRLLFPDVPAESVFANGRPDLRQCVTALPSNASSIVVVCGPQGMALEASQLAFEAGVAFETEEFHF